MAVIGCHCTPHFAFSPADAYDKNLTYRTGRCPARWYMSRIADSLTRQPVDFSWCVTHRFSIDQAVQAYDVFANRKDGCIKAVIAMR
jgi:threonine dehydrogenase-like Zn-dependent dehydrogenase